MAERLLGATKRTIVKKASLFQRTFQIRMVTAYH